MTVVSPPAGVGAFPTPAGLDALAERARAEIALFAYPDRDWVAPRTAPDGTIARDVVVVGAGQSGIAVASSLLRAHVRNIELIDDSPPGREGPWVTYGRMVTLRTLKLLTGPDGGIPALTFRAWHEAQFGARSWAEMVRIPRAEWMRYLVWLRQTFDLPVRNGARVTAITLEAGFVRIALDGGGAVVWARKLVLATGLSGGGGPSVPAVIGNLPRAHWAHSTQPVDFAALAGRRVLVIGAGASAYDNAATALEAGAARVDLLARRDALTTTTALRHVENTGFFRHFGDMGDADRWRFTRRMLATSIPPPEDTVSRATRFPQFEAHFGAGLRGARMAGDAVRIDTQAGAFDADFVIAATGFEVDLSRRPELAAILPHIALWRDRYTPPPEEADSRLGLHAYTGPAYEVLAREGAAPAGLSDIHLFNAAALASHGPTTGGLNGMPFGLARLMHGLTRDLHAGEVERLYTGLATYAEADPWAAAIPVP